MAESLFFPIIIITVYDGHLVTLRANTIIDTFVCFRVVSFREKIFLKVGSIDNRRPPRIYTVREMECSRLLQKQFYACLVHLDPAR